MRIPEWPQRSGFQRSTGGKRRSSMGCWRSARLIPLPSIGGRFSGIARSLDCFGAPLKAGVRAMEDRTAIVTGAGKRVGAVIAEALFADGWTVISHVHHENDEVGDGAIRVVADLAREDCATTIFAAAAGLPPVRLLVNNAARFAWDGFGEFSAAEFDRHMAVNVRAPALLMDELSALHDGEDALVVNMLDSKLFAPNADYLSYTLSKHALAALIDLAAR